MALKDEVIITNILLTRRCNLNCKYCRITRVYEGSPYKTIPTKKDELKAEVWFEFMRQLKNAFHVLYGGEPLLYDEIDKLIKLLNDEGIRYTIISNGFFASRLKEVPYGFSMSCDGFQVEGDIKRKTENAFTILPEMKKKGVKDVVAVFTMNRYNYKDVFDVVKYFTSKRIVTEITLLDQPKNPFYDLADEWKDGSLENIPKEEFDRVMDELKEMKKQGYLIHNNVEWFDQAKEYGRTDNYYCERPWNALTIDADGRLRLCYRIRGLHVQKYTIFDFLDESKEEEIKEAFRKDMKMLCRGCNWNCIMMAEFAYKNRDRAEKIFVEHELDRGLWYG